MSGHVTVTAQEQIDLIARGVPAEIAARTQADIVYVLNLGGAIPSGPGGTSQSQESNEYEALTTSPGNWAPGDTLTRIRAIPATGPIVTRWFKADGTELLTFPIVGTDVKDLDQQTLAALKAGGSRQMRAVIYKTVGGTTSALGYMDDLAAGQVLYTNLSRSAPIAIGLAPGNAIATSIEPARSVYESAISFPIAHAAATLDSFVQPAVGAQVAVNCAFTDYTIAPAAVNIAANLISIPLHQLGGASQVVSIKMESGTPPAPYTIGASYLFEIVDANTVKPATGTAAMTAVGGGNFVARRYSLETGPGSEAQFSIGSSVFLADAAGVQIGGHYIIRGGTFPSLSIELQNPAGNDIAIGQTSIAPSATATGMRMIALSKIIPPPGATHAVVSVTRPAIAKASAVSGINSATPATQQQAQRDAIQVDYPSVAINYKPSTLGWDAGAKDWVFDTLALSTEQLTCYLYAWADQNRTAHCTVRWFGGVQ